VESFHCQFCSSFFPSCQNIFKYLSIWKNSEIFNKNKKVFCEISGPDIIRAKNSKDWNFPKYWKFSKYCVFSTDFQIFWQLFPKFWVISELKNHFEAVSCGKGGQKPVLLQNRLNFNFTDFSTKTEIVFSFGPKPPKITENKKIKIFIFFLCFGPKKIFATKKILDSNIYSGPIPMGKHDSLFKITNFFIFIKISKF